MPGRLAGQPRLLTQFEQLLRVNQRYAVIREEQARDFTWRGRSCGPVSAGSASSWSRPVRSSRPTTCFCTRNEVTTRPAGKAEPMVDIVGERRHLWQRQRSLAAPLTLGQPVRLLGT